MSNLLPFIVAGIATGAVYGLAGVGLVLTYKTSGIFNFAQGAIATATAFVFFDLHVQHGLSWWLSALISIAAMGPLFGLVLERLARAASDQPLAIKVVATVGLLTFTQSVLILIYGGSYETVPGFLGTGTFTIGATVVTYAQLIILLVALGATVGLFLYFRLTRGGTAMRAVVDDPGLLDLEGTNPTVVRRKAWIVGASFAAVSGILLVQLLGQVDPTTFTLLIVQAFAAAAVGRFTNLPATFAGGIGLGIGAALCTKWFTTGALSGLSSSLPFVVLMVVLLLTPKGPLADLSVSRRTASAWRFPLWIQGGVGVVVLGFLCIVPAFAGIRLNAWTSLLAYVILFASLGLLVRTAGVVSLCQVSFQAIGVAAFSHLAVSNGLPWLIALLLAAAIAIPLGALLAIPAIRLSGLYLALVSLGVGLVLQYMFYNQDYMFGSNGFGRSVPRPELSWLDLSSDRGYYYLVLAITTLVAILVVVLTNGRLGRLLGALRASPVGLATSGASVNVIQVLVFCLSASLAAISGVLAVGGQVVSANNYQPLISLTLFVVIVISVGREPWYALIAAAGLTLGPIYISSGNIGTYLQLGFGLAAMGFVLMPPERRGVPASVRNAVDRVRVPRAQPVTAAPTAPVEPVPVPAAAPVPALSAASARETAAERTGLELQDIRVQFGGLVAVAGASLDARPGRITGLIGPNGAGKTTLFNACSGLNQPKKGVVKLDGKSIQRKGVAARARLGLGRTFQQMQLFDELTVAANVAVGREGGLAGRNPLRHLFGGPRQQRVIDAATKEALALCDLEAVADIAVGTLSTGQRRSVEFARCLAGSFDVLLLDEPSSGLDHNETTRFGGIVRRVVREREVAVLLVEHDLDLVTRICDYIYVLEFGQMLFEGTPAEVLHSEAVQAAYLGDELIEAPTDENVSESV
jgi:ABC-type branched-subunit amino acid transport system ATPase component/branched-subunit amino acid ABC-type transport system permease component